MPFAVEVRVLTFELPRGSPGESQPHLTHKAASSKRTASMGMVGGAHILGLGELGVSIAWVNLTQRSHPLNDLLQQVARMASK